MWEPWTLDLEVCPSRYKIIWSCTSGLLIGSLCRRGEKLPWLISTPHSLWAHKYRLTLLGIVGARNVSGLACSLESHSLDSKSASSRAAPEVPVLSLGGQGAPAGCSRYSLWCGGSLDSEEQAHWCTRRWGAQKLLPWLLVHRLSIESSCQIRSYCKTDAWEFTDGIRWQDLR